MPETNCFEKAEEKWSVDQAEERELDGKIAAFLHNKFQCASVI